MIEDSRRKGLALGAALLMATTMSAAADATIFTFTTSGGNDTVASSKVFTSNVVGGTAVKMNVTAWHWNNGDTKVSNNNIVSASLGLWSPGLGVVAPGESASSNEHQIDNIGGVDFLMLQFDRAVNLSSIGRVVYDLGFNPDDSDAAYWADSTNLLNSAPANYATVTPNLANYAFAASTWTTIAGNGLAQPSVAVPGAAWSSVWLIGAEPKDAISSRNDGFKLTSFVVSVPEPATWGMMVLGFGLVGGAIRRSRKFGFAFQA